MISSFGQTCICGCCVAAQSALHALAGTELLDTDEHWLAGPWLRLDDRVEVTADHPVLTVKPPLF